MNPFEDRQRGLTGSVIIAQGQSGTGKSHIMSECWLKAGMLFGGACFALAPVSDIEANVLSYRLGYEAKLDELRASRRFFEKPSPVEENTARALDFLRECVMVFRDASECFAAIRDYAEEDPGDGTPQFSLLIDEGAVARRESHILESVGPLARNLKGIVYVTGHRSMAVPPAIRAVRRATVLWRSSDGTGDEELEAAIAAIPGFKYSPVMSSVPKSERFYRGIRYTPEGPRQFEFNPYVSPIPDWMLLPALPTAVKPRILT